MNKAEGNRPLSDEDFDNVLGACWEQIGLFAFERYKETGRGVVFLDRHGLAENILHDDVDLGYAVYDSGQPNADAARMIEEYDPAWEIIFQYLRHDGNVRTARIRTAPGNRHPWRIYLFDQLLKDGEAEEE